MVLGWMGTRSCEYLIRQLMGILLCLRMLINVSELDLIKIGYYGKNGCILLAIVASVWSHLGWSTI